MPPQLLVLMFKGVAILIIGSSRQFESVIIVSRVEIAFKIDSSLLTFPYSPILL